MRMMQLRFALIAAALSLCAAYWRLTYEGHGDFGFALWGTLVTVIVVVGPRRFLRFFMGLINIVGAIG